MIEGAEAALRGAEACLQEVGLPPFDGSGSVPGLIGRLSSPGSAAYWSRYDWALASRQSGTTTLAGLKEQPRYVIEVLPAIPAVGESPKFGPLPMLRSPRHGSVSGRVRSSSVIQST